MTDPAAPAAPVVTRFAPSPTGYLHVGGARTAIFNWLLARRSGGRFILRIEDTDLERSTPEATQAILDGLTWLGLDWEELHFQSRRQEKHNAAVDALLESGHAYHCRCTPEEVQAMRDRAMTEKRKPKYDGTCRGKGLGPGPGRVVRLKVPQEGQTVFHDLVKGSIAVANEELDDLVLRRADGTPTYNLAVVVDDADMGVTTIIRGDDHVNNTPRQILLYRALGLTPPEFGHVPMILGPDKKKLSKRHGALSVLAYEEMGYLPEAMRNYLLRLGWSFKDKEIFSREEMIELFTVDNLGKAAAVFDIDKLQWLNSHYLREMEPTVLAGTASGYLKLDDPDMDLLTRIMPLLQPRAKTLEDIREMIGFFLSEELEMDEAAAQKFLTAEAKPLLLELAAALEAAPAFDRAALENGVQTFLDQRELPFKRIAQPMRVALTGRTASPGLFEIMEVLGREKTVARLRRAAA